MALTQWREERGKLYLYIDHGGSEEETIANLKIAARILKESRKTDLCVLCDGSKAFGTSKVVEELIQFLRSSSPQIKKWAFLGFKGLKKVVLKNILLATALPLESFDTEADALNHLFKDS